MVNARPATTQTVAPTTPGALPEVGSDLVFRAYLFFLFIEFLGLARIVPPLQIARVPTLLAWGLMATVLVKAGVGAMVESVQARLLLAFVAFTAVSVFYAIVQMEAFTAFRAHSDYFGLFIVTVYLVDRPARIRQLAVTFALIAVLMVARNVQSLTSTVRKGAMAGAYFTGDGNDFGWALCVFLPLVLFLLKRDHGMPTRLLGTVATLACVSGVIGTQSRGAALSVVAMMLYYWMALARRRLLLLVAAVAFIVGLSTFGPSYYMERLSTIEHYQDDESANTRLKMWGVATRMAIDNPFGVGAGNFSVAYGLLYLPNEEVTGNWGASRWLTAHSVYFRALGEYGLAGLLLVLVTLVVNFLTNRETGRLLRAKSVEDRWAEWPRLLNMSFVGYSVAGAFLGGLTYPHFYILAGLTASARRLAEHIDRNADADLPALAPVAGRTVRFGPLSPRPGPIAAPAGRRTIGSGGGTAEILAQRPFRPGYRRQT